MSLCLYAVCARRPPALTRRRGTCGEPLSAVACGELVAVVGAVATAPTLDAPTLRAHDAVVRRLAASVDALLPVRFGTMFANAPAVVAAVSERHDTLADALALVAGREQMTLRVFGPAANAGAASRARSTRVAPTTGTGYMRARHAADRRARRVPEIAWLRPALERLVQAERVERHRTPPLLASVHHLIPRGHAAQYLAAVDRASRRGHRVRVVATGPWPPWAFASEDVA
ncbi:MAG: GvpL/GvpF family gas vesicle protein [Candidatus Rokubacteria bacterium]|nr:GvpL/GvpF family gas vesicle protein [Candidatus Rokubacteria bacterium]